MADVASVPQLLLPQLPSTSSTSSSELNLNVTAEIPAPPDTPESSLSLNDKSDEPESKRFKKFEQPPNGALGSSKKLERLEMRLGSVLSCVVCLDLPKAATYQVSQLSQLNKKTVFPFKSFKSTKINSILKFQLTGKTLKWP